MQITERPEQVTARETLEKLIEQGGEQHRAIEGLIHRIFPAAAGQLRSPLMSSEYPGGWRKARRVAHIDNLRTYLEYTENDQVRSLKHARKMLELMPDKERLDSFLRSLPKEQVHSVLRDILEFEDVFDYHRVVPTVTVLFNLLPEIPVDMDSLIPIGPYLTVRQITKTMFERMKHPNTILQLTEEALRSIQTFHGRRLLISIVGPEKSTGETMITIEDHDRLLNDWCRAVFAVRQEQLTPEPGLLETLLEVREFARARDVEYMLPKGPEVTASILKSAEGRMRTWGVAKPGTRTSPTLAWDRIMEWFANDSEIRHRLAELKHAKIANTDELITLAEKYLKGWRPDQEEGV